MLLRRFAALPKRVAPVPFKRAAPVGMRSFYQGPDPELPADHPHQRTNRPEYLMNLKNYHEVKELVHKTSYFLAVGIPATLAFGGSISTALDYAMAIAIPAHFHVGMRAVLLDYGHFWFGPEGQKLSYKLLAAVTVLTALGLLKFNITDVGITEAVKMLWREAPAPKMA